ncbi:lymphocyte transmembrane adapter 1 [Perognathus longimembris pacificus]|uniref:lymphocyte transmembrane adapter 1 n=1 Tax=Perognathus longimembris pacificus TaxID=214514 RepID=UPI00201990A9|nr:lymphocyte transmembrane adapter 1 [Perognathus longimembris pacificus]
MVLKRRGCCGQVRGMAASPTPAAARQTSEPAPATLGSLEGDEDQSGSIFSGYAGVLAVLLVVTPFCIVWSRRKWKKRRSPYLQVTDIRSLTLPPARQRAKNIYDLLPRQQDDLGRHQLRSSRVFSAESLLSRNSPSPEHTLSQEDDAHQLDRAHIPPVGYTVGIYDNTTVPQRCGHLAPSTYYIPASRGSVSISSEESNDYVNVTAAEEAAETLTPTNNLLGNLFAVPCTLERELTEERYAGHGDTNGCPEAPSTEDSDPHNCGEDSSQSSDDYVNVTGLDLGDTQEIQPWVAFQCYGDYENVPPATPNGSQQQAVEEVVCAQTDHREDHTPGPGTHSQPVSKRSLSPGNYMAFQPPTKNGNSQVTCGGKMSDENSHDYENVLAADSEGGNQEHEGAPKYPAGKPNGVTHSAGSPATAKPSEDP